MKPNIRRITLVRRIFYGPIAASGVSSVGPFDLKNPLGEESGLHHGSVMLSRIASKLQIPYFNVVGSVPAEGNRLGT